HQFGHDRLPVYGIGGDIDARAWRGVFRQLVALGLLEVDAEGHGGLRLAEASRPVLRGEQPVLLRKDSLRKRGRSESRTARPAVEVAARDQPLFDALRALRTRLAREQGVPPYVIFHDATLREVARLRPRTPGDLGMVGGIGAGKIERYGDGVLDVGAQGGAAWARRRTWAAAPAAVQVRGQLVCWRPDKVDGDGVPVRMRWMRHLGAWLRRPPIEDPVDRRNAP